MDTKIKKLNLKEFIKTSPNRLQSLRLPRDLSLGGTKISKKVFKPNVNVVRNKNKIGNSKKIQRLRQVELDKSQKKQTRYVQSSGIFSEGIGLSTNSLHISKVQIRQEKTVETPIPIKKQTCIVNQQHENNILNIVKDEEKLFECIVDENHSFSPIQWATREDLVKSEYSTTTKLFQQKLPPEYNNFFSQHLPVLTLWQLPDSLCFENLEMLDKKTIADCNLSNISECKIGKICVHKSGKIQVYIGDFSYELESNDDTFTEELISLNCDAKTALVLGDIKSRFILSPNWNSLLSI